MSTNPNDLRWHKFPVLDDGHVCLVDVMGDDHAITDAARISFGKGTRSVSDDRTLIRYLMRCRHTSPFEQAELKFRVRVPMDTWRQWIRHRMANVNEYSTRYSEAIDAMTATPPGDWRVQSETNRQGSSGTVDSWPQGYRADPFVWTESEDGAPEEDESGYSVVLTESEKVVGWRNYYEGGEPTPGRYLSDREADFHAHARRVYEERLRFGVAREQARKDLPLSTYTEAYWKIDLHNLLHFLSLRMDAHAQQEIREYANIIGREIVAPLFPLVWEAFLDYRLNAMTLSALDIEVIRSVMGCGSLADPEVDQDLSMIDNKREREECRAKLVRLGII